MRGASPAGDAADLASLVAAIEREARRAPFDVCLETYSAAGRDPAVPILCAGALDAPVCFFGRELGREEVQIAEPLVGAGGRRLRRAAHEALLGPAPASERRFAALLSHVFLTNTVPYRPVDNRAYDRATVARFRPFVEELLGRRWTGTRVVALGQEAHRWFAPYAQPGAVEAQWADTERRFSARLRLRIAGRDVELACVPHPSPLSPFKARFAEYLTGHLRTP